jgi:hypothetical protein
MQIVVEFVEGPLDARITRVVTEVGPDLHAVDPVAMRWNVGQVRVSMSGRGSEPEQRSAPKQHCDADKTNDISRFHRLPLP